MYDHELLAALRAEGLTWPEIGARLGGNYHRMRTAHANWVARKIDRSREDVQEYEGGDVVQKWLRTDEGTVHVRMPGVGALPEDGLAAFWEDARAAFEAWTPQKDAPVLVVPDGDDKANLAVISIYDAHFGMRADPEEVGELGVVQDLRSISKEFYTAANELVAISRFYDPAEYLIPIGHDFSHVNQYMGKALTTRAGTEQDVDSRLWKIHRAVCDSSVRLIDAARSSGKKVNVVMVPGNHDPDENYKLGEYLQAWFRHDPGVEITNTPTQHKYFGWKKNAFMLTHGEHYMKKGGQSPLLVFANECPSNVWVKGRAGGRWILSGHLHARRSGQYTPTSDVREEAGIIAYVLPGLTATDDWHQRQGYRHQRAATLQVFGANGVMRGHHEVRPS